jgi:predicted TIM-barrel fold metal-dependent hydrolase
MFFSFEAEESLLPETFRYVGENHFVYATDIPHWDCEFPANLHKTQKRKDLTDEIKNKILYENVKALYGT